MASKRKSKRAPVKRKRIPVKRKKAPIVETVGRGRRRVRTLPPGMALAVEAVGGTTSALAGVVGITPQAVAVWTRVPIEHVRVIEKATGVPKELLRPDVFQ